MQSIVITGAGSGIGRATAQAFLAAGWQVALIGRRVEALMDTAGEAAGALVLPCDVTEPGQVETRVELCGRDGLDTKQPRDGVVDHAKSLRFHQAA